MPFRFCKLAQLLFIIFSCVATTHGQDGYQSDIVAVTVPQGLSLKGVIVLCPGQNADGRSRVKEEEWLKFAETEGFAIAAIAFQSPNDELQVGRGYFDAASGSGAALESALERAGVGDLPLYFLGFSGGAHFTMSFAAWKPERVAAFCVQGFARWISPPKSLNCPAIVSCGTHDGRRYGSSFGYFQAGRKNFAPWVWLSLGETSHEASAEIESFFREFVRHVSSKEQKVPVVVDNVTGRDVKEGQCVLTTSVLPSKELHFLWQQLHHP